MILVIGDIIVDEFVWGDVSRISPEAPVPVVEVEQVDRRLGGAANVVRNLHALDEASAIVGVVGDDEPGNWACNTLKQIGTDIRGIVTKDNGRPTGIKTRVIARHQQVVRYDHEWKRPILPETRARIEQTVEAMLPDIDAVILSDYGKGVLSADFVAALIARLQGKIIAIDPKPEHTAAYAHATLITPNLHEASAMAGMPAINDDEHVEAIARHLHQMLDLKLTLITRSEKGMSLFDGKACHHIATAARDVFDVTGAGDTVIAVFTACLARGDDPLTAARHANRAAGVVVGKVGTATASWDEIREHP